MTGCCPLCGWDMLLHHKGSSRLAVTVIFLMDLPRSGCSWGAWTCPVLCPPSMLSLTTKASSRNLGESGKPVTNPTPYRKGFRTILQHHWGSCSLGSPQELMRAILSQERLPVSAPVTVPCRSASSALSGHLTFSLLTWFSIPPTTTNDGHKLLST